MSKRYILVLLLIFYLLDLVLTSRFQQDRVIFLNVGQGDASLIQLGGRNILIDGGTDFTLLTSLSTYMELGVTDFDLVVLTHPHKDHMKGLSLLMQRYQIKNLLYYDFCYRSFEYDEFLRSKDRAENVYELSTRMNESRTLLSEYGLEILSPLRFDNGGSCINDYASFTGSEVNNHSIVLKLVRKEGVTLFTGDIELEAEIELLESGVDLNAEVLKGAHHCSDSSNSKEFLAKVAPVLIVCSVGEDNGYGHPGRRFMKESSEMGIKTVLTYQEGDVVVEL